MPLVDVARDPKKVSDEVLKILAKELPDIVARSLSVPGVPEAILKPQDVEVRFRDFGPYDVHSQPLEIVVMANDYPARLESLRQRTENISEDIRVLIWGANTRYSFWVWVRLAPGEFVEVM